MSEYELTTPVALFVFNRPELTRQVFKRVAEAKPATLYVIADGPREAVPEDREQVEKVRDIVTDPDWDCNLHTEFATTNMGVKERLSSGISWVLGQTDDAILLEDDCLPHHSFFRFCERMLDIYRGDERIMDISGTNPLVRWKDDHQDYHFSYNGLIWGWATWADAWEEYDPEMRLWADEEVRERVRDVIADDSQFRYAERVYQQTYDGEIETWDYQWGFARHRNAALSVVPSRNLVTNIGFGSGTFHEDTTDDPRADLPTHEMEFPIEENPFVGPDREYDRRYHDMRTPFWYDSAVLMAVRDRLSELLD